MKKRPMRRKGATKTNPKDKKLNEYYNRRMPKDNWLKYFRVVRYYISKKYDLSLPNLEMLLFLYSEGLFSRSDFSEFEQIMSWDKKRFEKLRQDGWIIMWRKAKGSEPALYEISRKAKQIVSHMYKKLSGEESISENKYLNPIFSSDADYMDKVYRRAIKRLNQELRQRPAPE
jgi:hypothetical protein